MGTLDCNPVLELQKASEFEDEGYNRFHDATDAVPKLA